MPQGNFILVHPILAAFTLLFLLLFLGIAHPNRVIEHTEPFASGYMPPGRDILTLGLPEILLKSLGLWSRFYWSPSLIFDRFCFPD